MPVVAWGGSRISAADAEAAARRVADRIAARIRRGDGFPERYNYGERPLREEIHQEYVSADGELIGAVTRNSYGVLVLNVAHAAFLDVDLPTIKDNSPLLEKALRWILGRPERVLPDPSVEARERLRLWLRRNPSWAVRVYRTRSGLRYLLTHATYIADDAEIKAAMEFLGVDLQYRRLCQAQRSFRARLTPKPWRIGVGRPPYRYPWSTAAEERAMRLWVRDYEEAARGYATCRFIEAVGTSEVDPEVREFLDRHDQETRAHDPLPLA